MFLQRRMHLSVYLFILYKIKCQFDLFHRYKKPFLVLWGLVLRNPSMYSVDAEPFPFSLIVALMIFAVELLDFTSYSAFDSSTWSLPALVLVLLAQCRPAFPAPSPTPTSCELNQTLSLQSLMETEVERLLQEYVSSSTQWLLRDTLPVHVV